MGKDNCKSYILSSVNMWNICRAHTTQEDKTNNQIQIGGESEQFFSPEKISKWPSGTQKDAYYH